MMKLKANMDLASLPPAGLTALRHGWCIDEDPNHLWLSKDQWLDSEHDRLYHEYGAAVAGAADLDGQFVTFVKSLGLPTEDEQTLLAKWEEDPEFEVEWT